MSDCLVFCSLSLSLSRVREFNVRNSAPTQSFFHSLVPFVRIYKCRVTCMSALWNWIQLIIYYSHHSKRTEVSGILHLGEWEYLITTEILSQLRALTCWECFIHSFGLSRYHRSQSKLNDERVLVARRHRPLQIAKHMFDSDWSTSSYWHLSISVGDTIAPYSRRIIELK